MSLIHVGQTYGAVGTTGLVCQYLVCVRVAVDRFARLASREGFCCFPLLYFVRVHRCTDEDLVWVREGLLIAAACILGFMALPLMYR